MAQYALRIAQVTADATSTGATTQGSISAPGGLQVPAGVSQIVQVIACLESNPGTTAGGHVWFVRLGGNGITSGEQDIMVGADESVLTTSGAAAAFMNPVVVPVSIPVLVNGTVTVNSDSKGTGTPTAKVCVGLVFA